MRDAASRLCGRSGLGIGYATEQWPDSAPHNRGKYARMADCLQFEISILREAE